MISVSSFPTGIFILTIAFLYISFFRRYKVHLPLPPGPKGFPIIGDLFNSLRTQNASNNVKWANYLELGKKYNSDIVHINILGDHTLALNSVKAVTELLEKRSGLYSDRPKMYMMNDLVGWRWNFAGMAYSSWWRLHRRTFHQHFQSQAVSTYHPFILQSTSTLLNKLASDGESDKDTEHEKLDSYVRDHAGSIILRVVYGMTSRKEIDDYVQIAYRASESAFTMNHGTFFVDYFPLLKLIPAWFPGASFRRKANEWAPAVSELVNRPWENLKASVASGRAVSCYGTKNLEKFNLMSSIDADASPTSQVSNVKMEEVIKGSAAIAYFGGSDTTVAFLMSSLFVMSHHSEVLQKAQQELDRVVGPHRLPDFNDRKDLPYVEAFLKEVERMYPVTPLAIPHRVITDDIYDGYFIPKGTTVVGNAWAVLHSEEIYQDPLKFNPGRFLRGDKDAKLPPNPELYAFGFGRRICPGRHFAQDAVWIVMACLLATCDITRPLDEDPKLRKEIDPINDFVDGIIVHPKPFKCRIVPRSSAAANLMKAGYPSEN